MHTTVGPHRYALTLKGIEENPNETFGDAPRMAGLVEGRPYKRKELSREPRGNRHCGGQGAHAEGQNQQLSCKFSLMSA